MAHAAGVPVLVDGAQAVARMPVSVRELGCDFYTFSGHKLYGPTGIGILWARREHLEAMDPWQGGGDMIRHVTFERTTYNDVPYKFEAGTPDIAGVIQRRHRLADRLGLPRWPPTSALCSGRRAHALRIPGSVEWARPRSAGLVSLWCGGSTLRDGTTSQGIAVRGPHHCTLR